MDVAAVLADLDDDQRRAVTTDSRLVAVIAGAGSGKTRVLTRRVAYRLGTETADARHTVVLTFTREAAGELRRRLVHLGLTDQITAGTFHSVAHGLLRQRWADRDETPRTIVHDRARIVAGLRTFSSGAARTDLDAVVHEMSTASARGLSANAYLQAVRRGELRSTLDPEFVADVMRAYEAAKRERRIVDLDDLLTLTIDALVRDNAFADTVKWRFRHLLVDEAQDLNPLQHRLVSLLNDGRDDLFMVGDPAQAIYGFTGSDPSLLVDVADRFPGVEIIRLPVNHRSTPQVVDAGRHVLRQSDVGTDIESACGDGPGVVVCRHDDELAEASAVATAIARSDPDLVRFGRVAVLARTHAALVAVRKALDEAGVAVRRRVDGAGSPIAPLLDEAYRLRDPTQLRRWIRDQHDAADGPDDPRTEVASAANEFLRTQPTGDGAAFRAWVSATDPFGAAEPGVELLTFHGAKGREWHTVHLVGCETSLVPHRSAATTALRHEETRLFYVAITRATHVLTAHWAERRGGYQRRLTPLLERFEPEVPEIVPPPRDLLPTEVDGGAATIHRLREWREGAARRVGVLPEALVPDGVLVRIASNPPNTPDELDHLTGLGAITSRRLFDGISGALTDVTPAPNRR